MRRVTYLVALMLVGWVGGCSQLTQSVERPTASLTGFELGEVTGEGFRVNFLADVTNPNSVALPVKGADYELGLGGVKVLSSEAKLEKGLAANAKTSVTLPVMVRFEDLLKAEREIVKSGGDVPFTLGGKMKFDAGGFLGQGVEVPVSYSGVLPLKKLVNDPQALLQSPAAKRLAQQMLTSWLGR